MDLVFLFFSLLMASKYYYLLLWNCFVFLHFVVFFAFCCVFCIWLCFLCNKPVICLHDECGPLTASLGLLVVDVHLRDNI